jgi:hypothetical protein
MIAVFVCGNTSMMCTQWQNHLTIHVSEYIPNLRLQLKLSLNHSLSAIAKTRPIAGVKACSEWSRDLPWTEQAVGKDTGVEPGVRRGKPAQGTSGCGSASCVFRMHHLGSDQFNRSTLTKLSLQKIILPENPIHISFQARLFLGGEQGQNWPPVALQPRAQLVTPLPAPGPGRTLKKMRAAPASLCPKIPHSVTTVQPPCSQTTQECRFISTDVVRSI